MICSSTAPAPARAPPAPANAGTKLETGRVFAGGIAREGGAVYAEPGAEPAEEFRKNASHD